MGFWQGAASAYQGQLDKKHASAEKDKDRAARADEIAKDRLQWAKEFGLKQKRLALEIEKSRGVSQEKSLELAKLFKRGTSIFGEKAAMILLSHERLESVMSDINENKLSDQQIAGIQESTEDWAQKILDGQGIDLSKIYQEQGLDAANETIARIYGDETADPTLQISGHAEQGTTREVQEAAWLLVAPLVGGSVKRDAQGHFTMSAGETNNHELAAELMKEAQEYISDNQYNMGLAGAQAGASKLLKEIYQPAVGQLIDRDNVQGVTADTVKKEITNGMGLDSDLTLDPIVEPTVSGVGKDTKFGDSIK